MFWLSIWELFRPVRLSGNPCATLISPGLSCAARPHVYFYLLRNVSFAVVMGLNYRAIIVITRRVWIFPSPCLESSSASLFRVLFSKIGCFSSTLLFISNFLRHCLGRRSKDIFPLSRTQSCLPIGYLRAGSYGWKRAEDRKTERVRERRRLREWNKAPEQTPGASRLRAVLELIHSNKKQSKQKARQLSTKCFFFIL